MAYHNTGYARNKILTVTKGDYTHSYDLCDAFTALDDTAYPALTDTEFARLTDGQFEKRRQDFIDKVYSLEEGLQTDCPDLTTGSIEWNPKQCPVSLEADVDDNPADM